MPRLPSIFRLSSYLCGFILVATNLSGCGSGSSSEVVARVGTVPITKALLDHWTGIEAIAVYERMPNGPVPKGLVPDPPRYTACMSYLGSHPPGTAPPGSRAQTQLRNQCRARYHALQKTALSFLITWHWIIGEGRGRGLTASRAAVMGRLEQVRRNEFPSEQAFRRHLALTGETIADEYLRSLVAVLSEELEQKLVAGLSPQQRSRAAQNFTKEFPRRWASRTSCRAGYVVPDCKEYRGSAAPEPVLG
jgi:hypothetical protein